jgi:hypothetical protein
LVRQDRDGFHGVGEDGISVGTAFSVVSGVADVAGDCGVSSRLLRGLQGLLGERVEAGKGAEDLSAVVGMLRGAD